MPTLALRTLSTARPDSLEQRPRLLKDPRVPKAPARDHDPVAPGLPPHPDRVLGGLDVAVADDRDVQRCLHPRDFLPSGGALVQLHSCPRMQGEDLGPGILTAQPDSHRIALLLVPSRSCLDRHRQPDRVLHGADDARHQTEILEAARAAVAAHHLLHRTAEVDIDEIRPVVLLHEGGGFRHSVRLGAEQLDTDGPLLLGEERPVVDIPHPASQPFARQELGHHDVGPERPTQSAKRGFRDPRHRSEEQGHTVSHGVRERHACEVNGHISRVQPFV